MNTIREFTPYEIKLALLNYYSEHFKDNVGNYGIEFLAEAGYDPNSLHHTSVKAIQIRRL